MCLLVIHLCYHNILAPGFGAQKILIPCIDFGFCGGEDLGLTNGKLGLKKILRVTLCNADYLEGVIKLSRVSGTMHNKG